MLIRCDKAETMILGCLDDIYPGDVAVRFFVACDNLEFGPFPLVILNKLRWSIVEVETIIILLPFPFACLVSVRGFTIE